MPAPLTATQRRLLEWAQAHGRDLPWRQTRDAWAVLVSEVMLQQTQVARVVPAWPAFLQRFPTPTACAEATQADVVTAWHGLGYNRRAVHLHRCACAIADTHGGIVPDRLGQLTALPGIGAYTARAVLAFAYERAVGIVDVNVARVHSRVEGRRLSARALQARADEATPPTNAWAWNQALLDLGATVCTKRAPRCELCPLRNDCSWRGNGDDPAATPAKQSPFAGSDRQGRGRLVSALRRGPLRSDRLASVAGWPDEPERARRVAMSLVTDGLAKWEQQSGMLCLR